MCAPAFSLYFPSITPRCHRGAGRQNPARGAEAPKRAGQCAAKPIRRRYSHQTCISPLPRLAQRKYGISFNVNFSAAGGAEE